jgi:hypothetical protein
MVSRLEDERELRYMETLLILNAIQGLASQLSGKDPGKGLQDLFRDYKNAMFPDSAVNLEESGKRTERILKAEMERGPMRVEAQQYAKPKRKKR